MLQSARALSYGSNVGAVVTYVANKFHAFADGTKVRTTQCLGSGKWSVDVDEPECKTNQLVSKNMSKTVRQQGIYAEICRISTKKRLPLIRVLSLGPG